MAEGSDYFRKKHSTRHLTLTNSLHYKIFHVRSRLISTLPRRREVSASPTHERRKKAALSSVREDEIIVPMTKKNHLRTSFPTHQPCLEMQFKMCSYEIFRQTYPPETSAIRSSVQIMIKWFPLNYQ